MGIRIILFLLIFSAETSFAGNYYGKDLCSYPQYECVKVARGQSWQRLFPNEEQRDVVQRLNRTYNPIWPGVVIAVPKDLENTTIFDISPFPLHIKPIGEKQVIIDQNKLAWGAYDAEGQLVKWGPISSGRDKCSDSNNSCRTLPGLFRIFSRENEHCRSNAFPIGRGGAKMPYCMYFHKGFAMHGSNDVPGYRDSHGCVRMFTSDAKWLNLNFVDTSSKDNSQKGTLVIVRPIIDKGKVS